MDVVYDNIVYDLQQAGGISTYWYELSKRILTMPEVGISFVEFNKTRDNVQRKMLDISPADVQLTPAGCLFWKRFNRVKIKPDSSTTIFHSSYFRVPVKSPGVRQVCTVHDFTHDHYFFGPRQWLHNYAKKRAVSEASVIIAVSEHTRNDVLKFCPFVDPGKVVTIYNGVSNAFYFLGEHDCSDKPFILYVGSRDRYKNFGFAVSLVSALGNFRLVIVGPALNDTEKRALREKLGDRYTHQVNISMVSLNELYNSAYCLLYPSSYEGFGLPVVEAMRAGCPFIALNASSIPEVAGKAGVLLNDLDIEEAIAAVAAIGNDRQAFRQRGFVQARQFSWDKCFNQTFQLYKDIYYEENFNYYSGL